MATFVQKVKFNVSQRGIDRPRGEGLIVIDPTDSKTIYAGSYKNGIFKSTDYGGKMDQERARRQMHILNID